MAHDQESELPSVDELLNDPSTSLWFRDALIAALLRDPIDAANDAEILARVLDRKCRLTLDQES